MTSGLRRGGRPPRALLLIFVVVGFLVVVLGGTVVRESSTAPDGWTVVSGRVVGFVEHDGDDGSTWAPIVEYLDASGGVHRVQSSVYSSWRGQVGDRIDVAYDPAEPGRGRVVGGLAGGVWLAVVGLGLLFMLVPLAVLVSTRRTRLGPAGLVGRALVDATGERTRFDRAGGVLAGAILPGIGAVLFLGAALFLLGQGFPAMLGSLVFGFFGLYMLLGAIVGLGRGLDRRAIEVGPDGVWLPGLGERRWNEFRDVRVEHFSGPAGGAATTTYRRLGFVPRDPALAGRRAAAERLGAAMGVGFYGLMTRLVGSSATEFAPFGVAESEVGTEAFEELLEAVRREVPLGEQTERPSAVPSPFSNLVRRTDEIADAGVTVEGGGAAGAAINLLGLALPRRWIPLFGLAQAGFFAGIVAAVLVPAVNRGPAGMAVVTVPVLLIVGAVIGVPTVRSLRRLRADGSIGPAMAVLLVAALVGSCVPGALGGGAGSRPGPTGSTGSTPAPGSTLTPASTAGGVVPGPTPRPTTIAVPPGEYRELEVAGRVPEGIRSAIVGLRVNTEGAGPGPADITLYEVGFDEHGSGVNLVPGQGWDDPSAGWSMWGDRVVSLAASDRDGGTMLRVTATWNQEVGINSLEFPVEPGAPFRLWARVRAPAASAGAAYVAVMFVGGSGVEGSRVRLALRP